MPLQEIDDQLELLRLKELFMSDIKIRSKMALLLSEECAEEIPPYKEFCEFAQCTPEIATMFTKIRLYDVILTRREIAKERKRLERMKHDKLQ